MKTILEFLQKKKITKAIADSEYEAVDLGLSVKWSSCNVGATKPEELGLLFQWGRTDGYKYGDKNHKFLSIDDWVTTSGTKYKKGEVLKPEDDAAHVNMKGDWRMPTKSEMFELYKLSHKYTELNGVPGYEFTGANKNSIFIPIAGVFNMFKECFYHNEGRIWTSSVHFNSAYYSHFLKVDHNYEGIGNNYPYYGYSVRGVCK